MFDRKSPSHNSTVKWCLGVFTAAEIDEELTPNQLCQEEVTVFSFPENYEEAEWLWSQPHIGDGILINGMLTVQCNTIGFCYYDDDNRKKVISTTELITDPAWMKYELVFHPELELYSVPKPTSHENYEAYCPLFLKKQVWYDMPRWVDVKNCGTKEEIDRYFGKDGRWSVVCGVEAGYVIE